MSNGPKNLAYFYLGAEYGVPILILVVLVVVVFMVIGTAILLTTL